VHLEVSALSQSSILPAVVAVAQFRSCISYLCSVVSWIACREQCEGKKMSIVCDTD